MRYLTLWNAGRLRARGHTFTRDDREAEHEAIDEAKREAEESILAAMQDVFARQQSEIAERLAEHARSVARSISGEGLHVRKSLDELDTVLTADGLFDLGRWTEETLEALQPGLLEAIRTGFETGLLRIDVNAVAFNEASPTVLEAISKINEKASIVPQMTWNDVNDRVAKAYSEGWTFEELAADISQYFDDITPARALRVATTSGGSAFESGQMESFRAASITRHRWSALPGARDTHAAANGQERNIGEPFEVGSSLLLHPLHPDGPASEIINCRCTTLPLLE